MGTQAPWAACFVLSFGSLLSCILPRTTLRAWMWLTLNRRQSMYFESEGIISYALA